MYRRVARRAALRQRSILEQTSRLNLAPERNTKPAKMQVNSFGNILIVDDKKQYREENSRLVSGLGFTPICAKNGWEAIEIFGERGGSISLVILDFNMPGMNGDEVLRRLKEIDPQVQVVICSKGLSKKKIIALMSAGAKKFIPKPILQGDLEFFIEALLGPREALAAQG